MRRTNVVKREGKRQEILDAAGRTFLRDGLQGASISKICTEAGISPGHLYHYFDSKETILEAIAEAYLTETEEYFATRTESDGVISTVTSGIERVIGSPIAVQALLFEMIAEASRNPRIAQLLHENTRRIRSLLADLIRKGQKQGEVDTELSPDIAASVVINMIDAAKMTRMRDMDTNVIPSVDMLSRMVAGFLSGMPRT